MPSLSCTSLDRLIEPASSSSSAQAGPSFDPSTPFSFYPPLYATPPQQRPPSPTAFSPSPYVLNFKRRAPVQQPQAAGTELKAESSTESLLQQQCHPMDGTKGKDVVAELGKAEEASLGDEGTPRKENAALVGNEVFEMELEKREASAYKNKGLAEDNVQVCNGTSVSFGHGVQAAPTSPPSSRSHDSVSDDEVYSTSARPGRCLEGWSAGTAARLEEERARRLKAEGRVALWQRRWNEIAKWCATNGVSLPFEVDDVLENESDSGADVLDQELVVGRLVGAAIARAVVRAEKEEELEHAMGVKNREISRLWDKLQYLELVNREMSQRNLEVTELTQRRKKRRQRRRKLALCGFCAAFCIGSAGLLGYKYIPWDQAKLWAETLLRSPAIEDEST